MKLNEMDLSLLFDYYGELLTQKQQACFDLYYNQDLSLGEIAQEFGISRQAVYDTLARAEGALRTMEEKTNAATRDLQCRRAVGRILTAAGALAESADAETARLAREILDAAGTIKE